MRGVWRLHRMLDRLEGLGKSAKEPEPATVLPEVVEAPPVVPEPKGLWMAKRQPWAYVVIPKSACTTAGQYLYYVDRGYYYHDDIHGLRYGLYKAGISPKAVRNQLDKAGDDLFTFSFVRDPYARLVSAFLDKVVDVEQSYRPDIRDRLTSDWGVQLVGGNQVQNFRNFVQFLEHQYQQWEIFQANLVEGIPDHREPWEKVDIHWLRQSWYLGRGRRHSGKVDFIGTVETMQKDLEQLSDLLGPPNVPPFEELPRFGAGPRREAPLEEYFDDAETMRVVQKYFASDFRFGYDREPGGAPDVLDGFDRAAQFEERVLHAAGVANARADYLDIEDDDPAPGSKVS